MRGFYILVSSCIGKLRVGSPKGKKYTSVWLGMIDSTFDHQLLVRWYLSIVGSLVIGSSLTVRRSMAVIGSILSVELYEYVHKS